MRVVILSLVCLLCFVAVSEAAGCGVLARLRAGRPAKAQASACQANATPVANQPAAPKTCSVLNKGACK